MLTQEDYLDNLLNGMMESAENKSSEAFVEGSAKPEKQSEEKSADDEVLSHLEPQGVLEVQEIKEKAEMVEDILSENITSDDISSEDFFDEMSEEDSVPESWLSDDTGDLDEWFLEEDNDTKLNSDLNPDFVSEMESISGLTEEEIERLLSVREENKSDNGDVISDDVINDDDIMSLLEDSKDENLSEIKELLHKSETNELIDDNEPEDDNLSEAELLAKIIDGSVEEKDSEETLETKLSPKEAKRAEKKAKREAKKIERETKKAEKKAEKEKAKATKNAAKAVRNVAKSTEDEEEKNKKKDSKADSDVGYDENKENGSSQADADDEMFDSDFLDSIMADLGEEAGVEDDFFQVDKITAEDNEKENTADKINRTEGKGEEDELSQEEISALFDDDGGEALDKLLAGTRNAEEEDGVELADLFSDSEIDDLLEKDNAEFENNTEKHNAASESEKDFPDFVALDIEENTQKKKGLLARIIDFFTEEDDESKKENEDIILSKENKDILDSLDEEEKSGKKRKKSQKDKKDKKDKKTGKSKKTDDDENEEIPKKGKEKKPKKPKKEKKVEPAEPGKKLSVKKIIPVVFVGITLAVLLFVFVNSTVDFNDRKTAREAYQKGDYQTCYQSLYGKKKNESEQIMYGKSESILRIRLWVREFEMFDEQGDRVRALDSLIQTVYQYPDLLEHAKTFHAEIEVEEEYARALNYLSVTYGLTESEALEIAEIPKDYDYTVLVTDIANGTTDDADDTVESSNGTTDMGDETQGEEMPDILPEEEELDNTYFLDNK